MELKFTKMHGCGNDYVYINCFEEDFKNPEKYANFLSDRRKGVGGDGIILICPSDIADAKMKMFNRDGSEGKMCGNGIRCVAKYLLDNKIINKKDIKIDTLSGIKDLKILANNLEEAEICVNMGKAKFAARDIPTVFCKDKIINEEITLDGEVYNITCVSMGNPHCVMFMNEIYSFNIKDIGSKFETNAIFPEGVNTEFIEFIDKNNLAMRVWERGSGETLACGTGACAAVVAACENGKCEKNTDVTVHLRGGKLVINYTDEAVFMTGNAVKVFEGIINI